MHGSASFRDIALPPVEWVKVRIRRPVEGVPGGENVVLQEVDVFCTAVDGAPTFTEGEEADLTFAAVEEAGSKTSQAWERAIFRSCVRRSASSRKLLPDGHPAAAASDAPLLQYTFKTGQVVPQDNN